MNYPLYLLKPEDAARLIVLEPSIKPRRLQFEHKRAMRIRPSKRNPPNSLDLKTIAKGNSDNRYWTKHWAEHFSEVELEFPRIAVLIGPLLRNGRFYSWVEPRLNHPHSSGAWAEGYSRDDFDWDMEYWDCTKRMIWEKFILGEQGDGPRVDSIITMAAMSLCNAQMSHCKAMLRVAVELRNSRRAKRVKPDEQWYDIGRDDAIAMQFKREGHTIRKIERLQGSHYEVRVG